MKFIVAFLSLLLIQNAANAKIYGPKRYDSVGVVTTMGGELFLASGNFDQNGQEQALVEGGQYTLLDFPLGFRYLYDRDMGLEAELKASFAASESSQALTAGKRTNSQIHEIRLSSDWLFETQSFDVIPELEFLFPLTKISSNTDDVMIGEGVKTTSLRLYLQTEFSETDFFGYLGYEDRDSGRSDLLSWSGALGWNLSRHFYGVRLLGFQSMTDDKDSNTFQIRKAVINKVNGGASRFYDVNPISTAAEGFWNFKWNRAWELQMHLGFDLAGENFSKGVFAGVNFVLDWGAKQVRKPRRKTMQDSKTTQPRGSGIAVESDSVEFQEDTQQLEDQQYFEPPPPPRRTRSKAPNENQLRQKMDDVEMQIELKKKKSP